MASTSRPMLEAGSGPFLFDTSAESWFARTTDPQAKQWMTSYMERHLVYVPAVTVLERLRGYGTAIRRADAIGAARLKAYRASYALDPERVLPLDLAVAAASAEILAMIPDPPSPPKRTHRAAESRADRLARWRFDAIVAATALVNRLPLMHDNPEDFEAILAALESSRVRLSGLGTLELVRCLGAGESRLVAGGAG